MDARRVNSPRRAGVSNRPKRLFLRAWPSASGRPANDSLLALCRSVACDGPGMMN